MCQGEMFVDGKSVTQWTGMSQGQCSANTALLSKPRLFGLKASRGLKNLPTDESWVSFEKFRKFSIRWSPRYSNLDKGKLR